METYRFCGCIPCFLRPREGCAFMHTPEEQHKRCEAPEASAAGTVGAGAVRGVPCPAVPALPAFPAGRGGSWECWSSRAAFPERRGEERRQPWCSAVMATRPGTPGSTASEHPSPYFVLGCAAAHWGDRSWEPGWAPALPASGRTLPAAELWEGGSWQGSARQTGEAQSAWRGLLLTCGQPQAPTTLCGHHRTPKTT